MGSTKAQAFKCTHSGCNKSFRRRADLTRHSMIHTNERPFECTITGCERRFNQRVALAIHLRTHTGERPYMCAVEGCNRGFGDRSTYARHQRVHTQEKPYLCSIGRCYKRFTRRSVLLRHQQQCHHQRRIEQPQCSPQPPSEEERFPLESPMEPRGVGSMIGSTPPSLADSNDMSPVSFGLPVDSTPLDVFFSGTPVSHPHDNNCSVMPPSQPPLMPGSESYQQLEFRDWNLQNLAPGPISQSSLEYSAYEQQQGLGLEYMDQYYHWAHGPVNMLGYR